MFQFGRGIEISKTGEVTICDVCGKAQGYTKGQLEQKKKKCVFCDSNTLVTEETIENIISLKPKNNFMPIIVGEDLHRYKCECHSFVKDNVPGINYKNSALYIPPKLLSLIHISWRVHRCERSCKWRLQ